MTSSNKHWNSIFSATSDPQLGWYEKDVSQTLRFLDLIPREKTTTVFLPGAGTSVLVDELIARGHRLILNDISDIALDKLKSRIGTEKELHWLHYDIAKPLPDDTIQADTWIDRAVLHFLLDETDIQGYFANLKATVRPGGYALLAEFAITGAPKCAGLELHRYSVEEMAKCLGNSFELEKHEDYTYINPSGDPRPYVYGLFRKQDG